MAQASEPKRAAAYYRISVYRGDGEVAPAIERQRELVQALAERKGWPIAEEYVDQDVSAYSGKPRKEYDRMLADIRSRAVDAVLVLDQDRLVRRTRELEGFIEIADAHGVALANVGGDIDLSTAEGRFKAKLMGNLAEYESEKKSERQRREERQRAHAGKEHGGPRPYGWRRRIDPETGRPRGALFIDAQEAGRLREAARRVLAGESVYAIAREWTKAGYPRTKAADWWDGQILRNMLLRPRNAGLRVHHPSSCCRRPSCPKAEIVADGQWEPLWDRETHERLHVALGRPGQRRRGRPMTHLLSGMVVCECGASMSTHTHRGKWRYSCRNPKTTCGGVTIGAERVEGFVATAVIRQLTRGGLLGRILDQERAEDTRAAQASTAVERCEAKLKQLAEDFADDEFTRAEWLAARERVERRLAEARRVLDAMVANGSLHGLPDTEQALIGYWKEATVDQRRAVLKAAITQVVVRTANRNPRVPPRDRVDILWRS